MLDASARPQIDPLAEQAATLLTKAMLTNRDREALWSAFRDLVDEQVKRLQESPVRQALDDLERRGVPLDLVARLAEERYRARAASRDADHQDAAQSDV
jgi:TPP-dependent pyruvate/acetoin dehydrogenase alpha subunit